MSKFSGWFYRFPTLLKGRDEDPPVQHAGEPLGRINPVIHELAWNEYAAQGHGNQSAQRIAERGGFSDRELIMLLADALMRAQGWTSGHDSVHRPAQTAEATS